MQFLKVFCISNAQGAWNTSRRNKRLPREVVRFIKEENASYKEIRDKIRVNWKIEVAKSTVSYYKRRRSRLKPLGLDGISREDWQWLQGLFSADGNKIINKDKYGKHYIVRISFDKTKDSLIFEKCVRIIKAISLTPTKLLTGNCLTIKTSSKLLFNALDKKPKEIDVTAAYIAGAIDGDGWVDHGAIQFGQSRVPELFDGISGFFKRRGIEIGIWTRGDNPNYRRMYIPFAILKSTGVLAHSIKAQRILIGGAGEI